MLAPGIFFLWVAQASLITGIILLVFTSIGWEIQLFILSVFSVIGVAVARRFFKDHPTKSDQPLLNRRTAQYIGRVFTLDQPIVNGQGKIKIDDSTWKVKGEDSPIGTRIKVVGRMAWYSSQRRRIETMVFGQRAMRNDKKIGKDIYIITISTALFSNKRIFSFKNKVV